MQKIKREILIDKAKQLLADGTVSRVLGWKEGEFCYDVTPAVFRDAKALEKDFIFGDFCGANFSKYLVSETRKGDGKVLVFLKPCDTYSFNQLLNEHRFDREKVYAVGIPCEGMLDASKIRKAAESFTDIDTDGGKVTVHTLYDGDTVLDRAEILAERCLSCKSKKHVAYDELLGEDGEVADSNRFDEVEKLEKMTPDERFAFWQGELSRCIRCNACRDVCPACTCEKCVFDNPESGVENKAISDSFEEKMFHIIRAFHVAGRCTDCGECSRVCPQHIPLHLLNRKFIKDINAFYGDYQAGATVGQRAPLTDFTTSDLEPSDAVKGGNGNA
ncbi:MAG: 4Fe-4S dicluster domain-containing protein [Eubacteriales bacterium]